MGIRLAIYGYDSDIGQLVLETFNEQNLIIEDFYPLSPIPGEYDAVKVNGINYFVQPIYEFDFSKVNVALFLTTQDESTRWVQKAKDAGCIVIDNSHLFSGDEKTPVIVPEINPFEIKKAIESRIVIPALAPSVQLCLALSVLHDEFGIAKANVTSLESVSEFGRLGTQTLAHETTLLLNGMAADHQGFDSQLAFNLHNKIGISDEGGYTDHENTISYEVSKILGKFERGFDITCLLVPVFYGHTMVVNVELEQTASLDEVKKVLIDSEFTAIDEEDKVLSPVEDIINQRQVLVSRIRSQNKGNKAYSFVIMMDNTRRGEAISCVEILKLLSKSL